MSFSFPSVPHLHLFSSFHLLDPLLLILVLLHLLLPTLARRGFPRPGSDTPAGPAPLSSTPPPPPSPPPPYPPPRASPPSSPTPPSSDPSLSTHFSVHSCSFDSSCLPTTSSFFFVSISFRINPCMHLSPYNSHQISFSYNLSISLNSVSSTFLFSFFFMSASSHPSFLVSSFYPVSCYHSSYYSTDRISNNFNWVGLKITMPGGVRFQKK